MVNMGQSPIPHYYYEVVREESLCGEHALCEHVFSDKLIADDANGNGKLCVPINRVGRRARASKFHVPDIRVWPACEKNCVPP